MTPAEIAGPVFIESDCNIGGCLCPAWADWFEACEDTDPDAVEEDRDPKPLEEWPFNPLACARPDICRLYRNHLLSSEDRT